jgi:hypothetical protein
MTPIMSARAHTHTHACAHTRAHAHAHTHVCAHMHTHMRAHACTPARARTHERTRAHTHTLSLSLHLIAHQVWMLHLCTWTSVFNWLIKCTCTAPSSIKLHNTEKISQYKYELNDNSIQAEHN